MERYSLQSLGCDNGSGRFERLGDLDVASVEVHNTLDLGQAVVRAVCAAGEPDMLVRVGVRDLNVSKLGDHYLVSFEADGQAFAIAATLEERS